MRDRSQPAFAIKTLATAPSLFHSARRIPAKWHSRAQRAGHCHRRPVPTQGRRARGVPGALLLPLGRQQHQQGHAEHMLVQGPRAYRLLSEGNRWERGRKGGRGGERNRKLYICREEKGGEKKQRRREIRRKKKRSERRRERRAREE